MGLIYRQKLFEAIKIDARGREGQYGDEWLFIDTIKAMPEVDAVCLKDNQEIITWHLVDGKAGLHLPHLGE